jgi:hypothetical protein
VSVRRIAARAGVVACVGAAGLLGVFKLDDAVAIFDYQADLNAQATFTERTYPALEFLPGGEKVMEDARLWMPEDAEYRIVEGAGAGAESRAGSMRSFLGVLLFPRRHSELESASWVFCHGCTRSTLGPEYEVLSDSGQGFQFARRRS